MRTKVMMVVFATMTFGCTSFAPMRTQSDDERQAMFQKMSGVYKVMDSRLNYSNVASLEIHLADKGGQVIATDESGKSSTYGLWKCEIANQAQARNFGSPVESVEELVRCDISSEYRYSHIYVGKVKSDYVVKSGALIKTWSPINIKSGYVIDFVPTTGIRIIDAAKQ